MHTEDIHEAVQLGLDAEDPRERAGALIALGLLDLAQATRGVTASIHALGNADAMTPMGAIEALGAVIKEGMDSVADSVGSIASSLE